MSQSDFYLAVDLGAESGRVIKGSVSNEKIELEEIHRFQNGPVEQDGSLRWDFEKLMNNVLEGLEKACKACGGKVAGVGVDSWGVDFGLLDDGGKLIENPYHYRDSRTDGIMDKVFEKMSRREIYDNTGIQFMQLNTIFQLYSMAAADSGVLKKAKTFIPMADLVAYHLCGRGYAEYTLASTTQLMDMNTSQWSQKIFDGLGLPMGIMPEVINPGTVAGKFTEEIEKRVGASAPVIAVGSHDTASAVAAVPATEKNWAYLSSGTWSLMGVETPKPRITDKTFEYQFTNEGGICNTIRLLKNIMGLWIVQECRRHWLAAGDDYSYSQLTQMAAEGPAFARIVNPNDPGFLAPGEMPERVNEYLKNNAQQPIEDRGTMIRSVLESLAQYYRMTVERIEDINQAPIDVLHMVGGGIQNTLLCQFTADALGKNVVAGPIEATATGNILMQAIGTGKIDSLATARRIVAASFEPATYQPQNHDVWNEKYPEYKKLFT